MAVRNIPSPDRDSASPILAEEGVGESVGVLNCDHAEQLDAASSIA